MLRGRPARGNARACALECPCHAVVGLTVCAARRWSVGASDAEAAAVCAAGASSPLFRAALAVARREAQGGGFNSEQAALTLAELVFTEVSATQRGKSRAREPQIKAGFRRLWQLAHIEGLGLAPKAVPVGVEA